MKANKGEWSEFYVFLKILENNHLSLANADLEPIDDMFITVLKVFRKENGGQAKVYIIKDEYIEIENQYDNTIVKIPKRSLEGKAEDLFQAIQSGAGASFEIPKAHNAMELLGCSKIKSESSKKSDIDCLIYDRFSEIEDRIGFSIKSALGATSTLLNAGETTNFIYEVVGLDESNIEAINNIETSTKIQDRIKEIHSLGGKLQFISAERETFSKNLRKIDSIFPNIISELLQDFFTGKASKVNELTYNLSQRESSLSSFGLGYEDYEYKMKNLLISSALGMVPGKIWDGKEKANGGYIIVKKDGDIVCYHLYHRDLFTEYLYKNTKFESSGSSKHNYAKLYIEDGKIFIKLNLQVRFIK